MHCTILVAVVLVFFTILGLSDCSGKLEVIFTSFSNPSGKDSNRHTCDPSGWGQKNCDTYLRVCVSSPRPSTSNKQCPKKIYKGNKNSFSMKVHMLQKFSILKKPYGAFVSAWDEDNFNNDDLIDTFSFDFTNKPTVNGAIPSWTSKSAKGSRSSDKTTLSYKYRIYCDIHYYGSGCDKYCQYTDSDNVGHYRCGNNGNKICLANWFLPKTNCLKYCRPRDDRSGHYNCDSNGDKICHPHWFLPQFNCLKYCRPRNDNRGHYRCGKKGDRICLANWFMSLQNSCLKYCRQRNDDNGHYNCDPNGNKICLANWFLPKTNCLKYCRPRDDSSGHYNCDSNGDKICHPHWYGQNCTVHCIPNNNNIINNNSNNNSSSSNNNNNSSNNSNNSNSSSSKNGSEGYYNCDFRDIKICHPEMFGESCIPLSDIPMQEYGDYKIKFTLFTDINRALIGCKNQVKSKHTPRLSNIARFACTIHALIGFLSALHGKLKYSPGGRLTSLNCHIGLISVLIAKQYQSRMISHMCRF